MDVPPRLGENGEEGDEDEAVFFEDGDLVLGLSKLADFAYAASAPVRQNWQLEEGRISGSS
jgi:hypothetical protein